MRTFLIVVGGLSWALAGAGCWLWWKVVHSPGDDNPIGLIGAMAAVLFGGLGALAFLGAALLRRRR